MENSTLRPPRILVVEDNPNDQELLRHQLRKTPLGNHVLFFTDPRKALAALRESGGAELRKGLLALFIDIHLPYMNGIELLRRIREIEGMEEKPVIIMTTDPHPDTLAACKELEVAFVAEKPVTFSQFAKVLADLLQEDESLDPSSAVE
jgi:CheY-like chemotaxis protein